MVIDSEYRKELIDWIGKVEFICPFSVTLSMKEHRSWEFNRNFRHFCNRLNQSYLQNSYRRYKKRLTVLVASEGNGDIRNHHHLIIDNPFIDRDREFVRKVRESWIKSELGLRKIEVEKMKGDGWIKYITKFKSKPIYKDSFDFENFHIN